MINLGYAHLTRNVLPGISNPHTAPRDASGSPNVGFNDLSLLVYQGSYGPPMSSSLSLGFFSRLCRDFEEQGYCLRGDLCPMEHGINRIVVDDMQSLLLLNFPDLISSKNLPGSAPVELHGKSNRGIPMDTLLCNYKPPSSTNMGEMDVYDPDQPLWNNFDSGKGKPPSGFALPLKFDKAEKVLDNAVGLSRGSTEVVTDNQVNGPSLASLSYLERGGIPRSSLKWQSQFGSSICLTRCLEKGTESRHSVKQHTVAGAHKTTQKARQSLYVSGIPPHGNCLQSLLSHFQ